MDTRLEQQEAFVKKSGWEEAELFPLKADASNRTYTRLIDIISAVSLCDACALAVSHYPIVSDTGTRPHIPGMCDVTWTVRDVTSRPPPVPLTRALAHCRRFAP